MNGKEVAERFGLIAITPRAKGHIVKLYLMRPTSEPKTVCGRYSFDRHTGEERITERTPLCLVCQGSAFDATQPSNFGQWAAQNGVSL